MLDHTKYGWDAFKKQTDIKGRSRGSNMKDVDEALKGYWDSLKDGPAASTQACFEVLKACNSWMKHKKDKALAGKGKDHFKTRWAAVKDLATAAFVETSGAMNFYANTNVGSSAIDYERKKLRSAAVAARPMKALSGGYGTERQMWLKSNKTANPISATTLHEAINTLTDQNGIAYDADLARDLGGAKVLAKDFDSMTMKDWIAIDVIMQKMEAKQGKMKRHVAFLKKADRLQYMAVVRNGKLTKSDGNFWDTGAWDEPFAMDEYGNLFIGSGAIVTPSARLNHSSLLAGKDVLCAGTLRIQAGVLTKFNNNSGHYKPTGTHVYQALLALQDEHVDLSQTKVTIVLSETHGFGDLTVAEVIAAQGQFAQPHPKYY